MGVVVGVAGSVLMNTAPTELIVVGG